MVGRVEYYLAWLKGWVGDGLSRMCGCWFYDRLNQRSYRSFELRAFIFINNMVY